MLEDDEGRSAIESSEGRSARHARLVFQAASFVVVLTAIMFTFVALWLWFRDGAVDFMALLVPMLIIVVGMGIGMGFELRKRW
jgi:cation transport ATPase